MNYLYEVNPLLCVTSLRFTALLSTGHSPLAHPPTLERESEVL